MEEEISICIVLTVQETRQNGNYITAMINDSRLFCISQQETIQSILQEKI